MVNNFGYPVRAILWPEHPLPLHVLPLLLLYWACQVWMDSGWAKGRLWLPTHAMKPHEWDTGHPDADRILLFVSVFFHYCRTGSQFLVRGLSCGEWVEQSERLECYPSFS
jgi:hypothetical protein